MIRLRHFVASAGQVRLRGSAASARQAMFKGSIAWLAAGIVAHLLLAERGGFVIASAALFWFTARAFDPRRPWRDAVFAVVISIAAYLMFARMLQLSLPSGILAGWL